jgi:hypothetical protein
MAGGESYIWVNGYRWLNVSNETSSSGRVHDIRDVVKGGGDPNRVNTVTK